MKKLLFLGACLVALASVPVKAQTGGAETVVVRISSGGGRVYVATATGLGKAEVSEIEVPTFTNKNIGPIADIYQQTVAKFNQQGYTLRGISGGEFTTTLIFTKGQ